MTYTKLASEDTYKRFSLDEMNFRNTSEIKDIPNVIFGQERAQKAIDFGLRIENQGFNLFIMGPEGHGKKTILNRLLDDVVKTKEPAKDWCYVNNFEDVNRPLALSFPVGDGRKFKNDIHGLIYDLLERIPKAFNSDEYHKQRDKILRGLNDFIDTTYRELEARANAMNMSMNPTDMGFIFSPTKSNGELYSDKEFQKLAESKKEELQSNLDVLRLELEKAKTKIQERKTASESELRKFNQKLTWEAAGYLFSDIKEKYHDKEKVLEYLDAIFNDVITHLDSFIEPKSQAEQEELGSLTKDLPGKYRRFEVNLLVDHDEDAPVPVVYEDLPTYTNLMGRIEHQAQMGFMITNFTYIRPGAIHRANGGYLIIDARKLLTQPFSWELLKRVLSGKQIKMDPIERQMGMISTISLEPEPIPFRGKVILVGERMIYYLIHQFDPDFKKLFKVEADFEEGMNISEESKVLYAKMIAGMIRKNEFLPLSKDAVERIIEEGVRETEDSGKFSAHFERVQDILHEADFVARQEKRDEINREIIQAALDARQTRTWRIPDKLHESINKSITLIQTEGEKIAQVNALSVVRIGNLSFGHPSRITAQTRPGKEKVIDIEREVELGGPIHSKGVLILIGFIGARYGRSMPLGLVTSLVFEQSYAGVEGDSATIAEVCAIISSLSEVPIKQGLAVTGSMNQLGEVQAIGGVNEKIEGFFDVCLQKGLTGEQGVLIPDSNVQHLMLKEEVRQAIDRGEFHIYSYRSVDDALELLCGRPVQSIDDLAMQKLREFSSIIKEFMGND